MRSNRSMPQSTVIPVLGYPDVEEAIRWLCDAFGFTPRWQAGNHRAQLNAGDGVVAVTEQPLEGIHRLPGERYHSHSVMVRVEDVNAHFERSSMHGARILSPPADYPYGERQYTAEDLAGHVWIFSQSIADVTPEEWGGTSVQL
jgi:uncharacterized glyoxalase superfamily protein PhnB